MRNDRAWQSGFTLLELMVACVIVTILVAIAWPRYQMHVVRARRMAAISCLMDQAQVQERWRTRTFSYSGAPASSCASDLRGYRLQVSATRAGYLIEALPVSAMGDRACGVLSLDHAGARSPARAACW